jgi:Cu(I)/Ag(I) efflux system membrane fusion protein
MRRLRSRRIAAAAVLALITGSVGAWIVNRECSRHAEAVSSVGSVGRSGTVLFWYDPMRPDQHFDAPGKSPFMDMQLVPKYADDATNDAANVRISAEMAQNLGMRTAPVVRGGLANRIDASGRIEADERSLRQVSVRATGWVEVLNVRAQGDAVERGQVLAEVYSPALDGAQREFLLALESGESMLVDVARDKLLSLGFTDDDVGRLERTRHTTRRIDIRSPMHGYVMALMTREGAAVTPDAPLFELVAHDPLWVIVNLPESQSAAVATGSDVEVHAAAHPGRTFAGAVDYLYPELDMSTRTRRTRIVLANPNDALHPGMFVDVSLAAQSLGDELLVPSEAVIRTGHRDVVIVAAGEGTYRPAHVVLGAERDGKTVVLSGLNEGDRVVTSGQFLIDSEASLRGAYNRMPERDDSKPGSGAAP